MMEIIQNKGPVRHKSETCNCFHNSLKIGWNVMKTLHK